jgi:hypothetical protein
MKLHLFALSCLLAACADPRSAPLLPAAPALREVSAGSTISLQAAVSRSISKGGGRLRRTQAVQLTWSGALTEVVDIYRDGTLIAGVPGSSGFYQDVPPARGTYAYRVCDGGTQHCSNEVSVRVR